MRARSMAKKASAVRSPSSSPAHRSATAAPSVSAPESTSVTIGPWTELLTVRLSSLPPRTRIVSDRLAKDFHSPRWR